MDEIKRKPHSLQLTIRHGLYAKLKEEYAFKGQPVVSFAVIGKIIECYEKKYKSVELKLKGE